jgi:hypothetical protein
MAFTGFGNPRGEWTYVGVGILFIEMITSPVWVIKLIVQGVRISEVKKALRRPDLKLGILNCPMNLCPRIFNTSPAFGVTLSFHF